MIFQLAAVAFWLFASSGHIISLSNSQIWKFMVQGFSLIESIWPIGLHRLRLKTTICHRSTPPEPLPRCAFQTLAVADPPMLRSLSRLFMRHRARAAEPAADCAGGDCLQWAAGGHWGWEGDEAWHIFLVFLQFLRFFVRVCFFRGEFLSNLFKTDLRSLYASRVWMICGRFSEDKRGCTWSWLGGC